MLRELECCDIALLTPIALWLARPTESVFPRQWHVTSVTGTEQGCPASPESPLDPHSCPRSRASRTTRLPWCCLTRCPRYLPSCLGDITCMLPPSLADKGFVAVEEELDFGLSVNRDKRACAAHLMEPARGTLWDNVPRHDGFVACGTPITYDHWMRDQPTVLSPSAAPRSRRTFLAGYQRKVARLLEVTHRELAGLQPKPPWPTSSPPALAILQHTESDTARLRVRPDGALIFRKLARCGTLFTSNRIYG